MSSDESVSNCANRVSPDGCPLAERDRGPRIGVRAFTPCLVFTALDHPVVVDSNIARSANATLPICRIPRYYLHRNERASFQKSSESTPAHATFKVIRGRIPKSSRTLRPKAVNETCGIFPLRVFRRNAADEKILQIR
jgi:hypothetical protein